MIGHDIFRVVSRFPRYISCYIAESRLLLGQGGTTVAMAVGSSLIFWAYTVRSTYTADCRS